MWEWHLAGHPRAQTSRTLILLLTRYKWMFKKKKKRLLAIRVKEKSYVEHFLSQMLVSVGLRKQNNLDFALPWVTFLLSLGPFPPRFLAYICFTGLIRMKPPWFTTISGNEENRHRSQEKTGSHVFRQGSLTWELQRLLYGPKEQSGGNHLLKGTEVVKSNPLPLEESQHGGCG